MLQPCKILANFRENICVLIGRDHVLMSQNFAFTQEILQIYSSTGVIVNLLADYPQLGPQNIMITNQHSPAMLHDYLLYHPIARKIPASALIDVFNFGVLAAY